MSRRSLRSAGWGALIGSLWSSVAAAALALGGRSLPFLALVVVVGAAAGAATGVVTEVLDRHAPPPTTRR